MNLLLVRDSEREGDLIRLRGARASHVREVLRAQPGQRLRVGFPRAATGDAQVLSISAAEVVLGEFEPSPSPSSSSALSARPSSALHLILALPRPKALRRILQCAASFGVEHIDLVNAWRVSKSYWSSPLLRAPALIDELWLGCEQGRHTHLPTIATHPLLVPYLREMPAGPDRYLAHPGSETWLADLAPLTAPGCLAIGPEGGWIESELHSFQGAGFVPISISRSVLRSEVAIAAALAQWELCGRGGLSAGSTPSSS